MEKRTGHPERFWIIGAGRFGRIAVERIVRHIPRAVLTIVDENPLTIKGSAVTAICQEGVGWLMSMLDSNSAVDMVVPAIPVHVAAAWLRLKLMHACDIQSIPIPDSWLRRLPNAYRGKTGQAFTSHADFICPDHCPEPKNLCTHTGKPRPEALFRLLGKLAFDDVLPVVLRSHQLLPGVGGIYPADLLNALETACKNHHRPLMIATACRCHGVVDLLKLRKKPNPVQLRVSSQCLISSPVDCCQMNRSCLSC